MPSGVYTHKPHSLKTKMKISKAHIGKPSGMKGKHHAKKSKIKLSESIKGKNHWNYNGGKPYCKNCGKLLTSYKGIHCQKCYDRKGEKSGTWIDGRSFEPYTPDFNQQLKDKIRVRDNFICQKCGVPELECNERLSIHHIDYVKENCKENNLISLCRKCNSKVNTNREYWINYFIKLQRS